MGQTSVNIQMDEELKQEFDELCDELGLSMTAAVNVFAKTVVRQRQIPFLIAADTPNAGAIAAMEEIQKLKLDPNKKKYANFAEVLAEVNAELLEEAEAEAEL